MSHLIFLYNYIILIHYLINGVESIMRFTLLWENMRMKIRWSVKTIKFWNEYAIFEHEKMLIFFLIFSPIFYVIKSSSTSYENMELMKL